MARFVTLAFTLSLFTFVGSADAAGNGARGPTVRQPIRQQSHPASSRPMPTRTAQPSPHLMQNAAARPLQPQRAPEKLTQQQVAEGLHMNRVQVHLSGNMHFPGWWEVVPKDTSVVIAQGAGYKGKSVTIGGQKFENAAAIHINPNAGFNETANLHILGKAGEEVRVVYIRTGPNATIHEANGEVTISNVGQGAMVGGDAHRRDVKLTIKAGNGIDAVPGNSFVRYLPDHYGWSQQGAHTTSLGGGANSSSASSQYVEPMFAPGHGPGGR